MIEIHEMPQYWWDGQKIGIVSDAPGAPEAAEAHPDLEAKTLAEWQAQSQPPAPASAPQQQP